MRIWKIPIPILILTLKETSWKVARLKSRPGQRVKAVAAALAVAAAAAAGFHF